MAEAHVCDAVPGFGRGDRERKSALALELAEVVALEVVSADAMMVYREMDIAPPNRLSRTGAGAASPHRRRPA
jgi:hypothetical protein